MASGLLTKQIGKVGRVAKAPRSQDDLYEMANLFPDDTGLPVTVWVSPRGRARHAARIKVCRVPGNRMVPSNTAAVAIEPEPRLIAGQLPAEYLGPVMRWVTINRDPLLEYWYGDIGTGALIHRLRRVPEHGMGG